MHFPGNLRASWVVSSICLALVLGQLVFEPQRCGAAEPPAGLQPIGGRWFIQQNTKEGEKPVYFYRDGEQYVDLFSHHTKDSNKDGIDEVKLSHDEQFLIMESQGYPNHPTAVFPNSRNPNSIKVQKFKFRLPLEPKLADEITRVPMGPIGTALNGVVFFNPFEMEGMNAVEGYSEVWLDSCCGHPQQTGIYHYHKYPACVKSPFPDDSQKHSPIIGFAFDGFPLYGPYEAADVMAKDLQGERALDVCNGHRDEQRGYHYHVTPGRFPYILGGYAGVVETSNSRPLGRAVKGALKDNTQLGSRLPQVITAVRPGTANREQTVTIQFELNPENARRPLPTEKPTRVQMGPYEGSKIARDGNIVKAEFTIPKDAPVGVLFDCHLELTGREISIVIKRNNVFQVGWNADSTQPLPAQAPSEIVTSVQPYVDRHELAGAVMLVANKEKMLLTEVVGWADIAGQKKMTADAMFWIASQSKPITAAALMILVDEGRVGLDDPVEKYLPEFRGQMVAIERDAEHVLLRRPKHPITVRNVLAHTSGLPFKSALEEPNLDQFPLAARVRSYALMPLDFEPDTKYQYSNAGINTAGRIIEVVTKMSFEKFLEERLCQPLGMKDTTFWPTAEQANRIAKSYKPGEGNQGLVETTIGQLYYPLTDRAQRFAMPAGGLFSTAHDVARFYQMLLGGGQLDGKRILSESAVQQLTSRQTAPELPTSYGLGFALGDSYFGHGGAYSTNSGADTKSGLIYVWLVQHAGFPGEGGKSQDAFKRSANQWLMKNNK